jgi:threonine/homoserine/homoserine lactone efflux protein
MGAATADGFYGFVSAFGLTAVSGLLISGQFWIRLIGGAFLLYLAAKTFMSEPATKPAQTSGKGLWSTYITTVFLTLTNPATILSFAAIFAGLGIGSETGDYLSATLLVLGVFLGSAAWWLLLSGLVSLFRSRFNLTAMRWVNRLSGVVLLGFSVYALVGIF